MTLPWRETLLEAMPGHPQRAMMSACEVVTWIAFRRVIGSDDLNRLFRVTTCRWIAVPATSVLEALEGRAGLLESGAFCAIRLSSRAASAPASDAVFTRRGPALLRHLRAQHRMRSGQLLSYRDLAEYLRYDIKHDAQLEARLAAAAAELKDRVAGELLVSYGRLVQEGGSPSPLATVSAISPDLFRDPAMRITQWDTLEPDTTRPAKEWQGRGLTRLQGVQFKTAQVLHLWPPTTSMAHTSGLQAQRSTATSTNAVTRPRGPRPSIRDRITAEMVSDYQDNPASLREQKEAFLAAQYGVSRDTARKARQRAEDALEQLSHNSAKQRQTPTLDK